MNPGWDSPHLGVGGKKVEEVEKVEALKSLNESWMG
jgi:hypothetical protein